MILPQCRYLLIARFYVLTAVLLKFQVFWDVRPCSWTSLFRRPEELQCLHRQGQAVSLDEGTTIRRSVRNFSPNAFQTSIFISLGLVRTSVTVLGKHTACDPALKLSR
jgi:hypothetical protein